MPSPQSEAQEVNDLLQAELQGSTMVSVRMPCGLYDEVCRLADLRRTSSSAIIRASVTLFLRRAAPDASV